MINGLTKYSKCALCIKGQQIKHESEQYIYKRCNKQILKATLNDMIMLGKPYKKILGISIIFIKQSC